MTDPWSTKSARRNTRPGFEQQPPQRAERPRHPRPEERRGTKTDSRLILFAEDENAVRQLTIRILENAGFTVLGAADGVEALYIARNLSGPPDLLLTDVMMPGVRGPELAETLLREGLVQRAVFVTGSPDRVEEAELDGLVAWELVSKPFRTAELLAAIERVLNA